MEEANLSYWNWSVTFFMQEDWSAIKQGQDTHHLFSYDQHQLRLKTFGWEEIFLFVLAVIPCL